MSYQYKKRELTVEVFKNGVCHAHKDVLWRDWIEMADMVHWIDGERWTVLVLDYDAILTRAQAIARAAEFTNGNYLVFHFEYDLQFLGLHKPENCPHCQKTNRLFL